MTQIVHKLAQHMPSIDDPATTALIIILAIFVAYQIVKTRWVRRG